MTGDIPAVVKSIDALVHDAKLENDLDEDIFYYQLMNLAEALAHLCKASLP